MHGSKLSEFIQSDVPIVTLYYWYQMKIQNSIWIGHSKIIETLEELEIQYSQAVTRPEQETNSHNRLLEAL